MLSSHEGTAIFVKESVGPGKAGRKGKRLTCGPKSSGGGEGPFQRRPSFRQELISGCHLRKWELLERKFRAGEKRKILKGSPRLKVRHQDQARVREYGTCGFHFRGGGDGPKSKKPSKFCKISISRREKKSAAEASQKGDYFFPKAYGLKRGHRNCRIQGREKEGCDWLYKKRAFRGGTYFTSGGKET